VDFGRTATVSQRNREATFDLLLAVFDDDSTAVTEALLAMTGMPPDMDLAALEMDVTNMLAQYRRQQASGGNLDKLMQTLLTLMREHRLQVPAELTVPLITLGVLDGVATQIDPTFRLIDATKPFARQMMPQLFGPQQILKTSLRAARSYGRFFDQLPVQSTRALRRMAEGEFKVAVRPTEFEALVERLAAGFYMLAYALIVGALIIRFSILVGTELVTPERIIVRIVLFLAVASLFWFIVRFVRNWWRKRKAEKLARR